MCLCESVKWQSNALLKNYRLIIVPKNIAHSYLLQNKPFYTYYSGYETFYKKLSQVSYE
jgi:hypothetical protein